MVSLKRDPTGQGFMHLGSDNVVRTLDRRFRVVDAAPMEGLTGHWSRDPDASVLEEIKLATSRSYQEIDARSSRPRDVLSGRQDSCVSENCPNNTWCIDLWLYGYNCTYCMMVSDGMGNCLNV